MNHTITMTLKEFKALPTKTARRKWLKEHGCAGVTKLEEDELVERFLYYSIPIHTTETATALFGEDHFAKVADKMTGAQVTNIVVDELPEFESSQDTGKGVIKQLGIVAEIAADKANLLKGPVLVGPNDLDPKPHIRGRRDEVLLALKKADLIQDVVLLASTINVNRRTRRKRDALSVYVRRHLPSGVTLPEAIAAVTH